jgi:hypothetical protein
VQIRRSAHIRTVRRLLRAVAAGRLRAEIAPLP